MRPAWPYSEVGAISPKMVTLVVERARAIGHPHDIVVDAPTQFVGDIDGLRVEQVLSKLVDNAIKYSPNGGTIVVRVAESPPGSPSSP